MPIFETYTDDLVILYNDLYDKKVRKNIEGYLGKLKSGNYSINPLKECQNIKRDFHITKDQWNILSHKIDEYRADLELNFYLYYRGKRNWLVYRINRIIIRVKYFMWIICWYITV